MARKTKSKYVILFYHEGKIDGVRTENSKKDAFKIAQEWYDDEETSGEVEVWGFGMGRLAASENGDFS